MELPVSEYALLWADVTEFTQAMEVRELDMGARTMAWVEGCVSGWLPELGGLFLQQAGDAILLAFTDGARALQAALRLQRDWATLAPRNGSHDLRIALHWGRVIRGAHGYVAHSLNQLSRLSQRVHAGQIWCSEIFRNQLPLMEQRGYEDLGWMHFRHLDRALRVFRVPLPRLSLATSALPVQGPVMRLLVQSEKDSQAEAWTQAWLERLKGMTGLVASELVGKVPANAEQAGELMQQTRAEFLLLRRTVSVPRPKVELLAAPWAILIQSWQHASERVADWATVDMARELKEALGAHVVSVAQSQPESALSHGFLQSAALQMMHAGNLQDFKRAGHLLTTWQQRYKRHAQPHVWMVLWHIMRHTRGLGPVDTASALAHAREALSLEPDHAHAHAALGFAMAHLSGDIEGGWRELEVAHDLQPHLHWTPLYRSVLWCLSNQPDKAMPQAELALRQAPQDVLHGYSLGLAGHAAVFNHQPHLATRLLEASWRQHRHYSPTLRMLVVAHQMQHQPQLARFFLNELLTLEPGLTARQYLARTRAGHARRAEMAHWLMEAGLPMK